MSIESTSPRNSGKRKRANRKRASAPSDDPLALLDKKQLAALLGVNVYTIDVWRKKQLIPPPIGLSPQVIRWRRSDIDRWMTERQLQPVPTRVVRRVKRRMPHA